MNHGPAFNRAIDACHHLADPEPPWTELLAGACAVIGGDSATFITLDGNADLLAFEQHQIDPSAQSDYMNYWCAHDIVTPKTFGMPVGSWFNTHELFSPTTLGRNPYYVDFMCRHRVRQMVTFLVEEGPTRRGGLTVQRAVPVDPVRERLESQPVRMLMQAMLAATAQRREATARWLAAADHAFDAFSEALCVLNGNGWLFHCSARARAWLDGSVGLGVHRGHLWHRDAKVRAAIANGLARVLATGKMVRLALPIENNHADRLDLVRAGRSLGLGLATEPLILVRIGRSERALDPSSDILQSTFGLTPAETGVLAALVEGQVPKQYAAAHDVSVHTVRKQIASLMDKMACTRQLDLVRKAMRAIT